MSAVRWVGNRWELAKFRRRVGAHVDLSQRFPVIPFHDMPGYVTIFEHPEVVGGSFGDVISALASECGDDRVWVLVLEPTPQYYRKVYGIYSAFEIPACDAMSAAYSDAMCDEPGGELAGILGLSLEDVVIVGSSGRWGVWAQLGWEIGVLVAPEADGPWLRVDDAPWHEADVELDEIRGPVGWVDDITVEERAEFARQIDRLRPHN